MLIRGYAEVGKLGLHACLGFARLMLMRGPWQRLGFNF